MKIKIFNLISQNLHKQRKDVCELKKQNKKNKNLNKCSITILLVRIINLIVLLDQEEPMYYNKILNQKIMDYKIIKINIISININLMNKLINNRINIFRIILFHTKQIINKLEQIYSIKILKKI